MGLRNNDDEAGGLWDKRQVAGRIGRVMKSSVGGEAQKLDGGQRQKLGRADGHFRIGDLDGPRP